MKSRVRLLVGFMVVLSGLFENNWVRFFGATLYFFAQPYIFSVMNCSVSLDRS